MIRFPAFGRAVGILSAMLFASLADSGLAVAQTPPPQTKKKSTAPPPKKAPQVSPNQSGVIKVAGASNLAGTIYASGAAPAYSPLSSRYSNYPPLNVSPYLTNPAFASYYSPYAAYSPLLPGVTPYAPYAASAYYAPGIGYSPYASLYGASAYPAFYAPNPLLTSYPSFMGFGQPNPFDPTILRGIYAPGAGLSPFTGLASWNNPFGVGMGLGGLGN